MNVARIFEGKGDFEIFQTTSRTQTAVMRLGPGDSSAESPEVHAISDQVVLVLVGDLHAEVDEDELTIRAGGSLVIPAGSPHRLVNRGQQEAFAFTTYSPPAYPDGKDA